MTEFITKKRKMVAIVRDPRDVCVSYYDYISQLAPLEYEGKFDGFIELFLTGKGKRKKLSYLLMIK